MAHGGDYMGGGVVVVLDGIVGPLRPDEGYAATGDDGQSILKTRHCRSQGHAGDLWRSVSAYFRIVCATSSVSRDRAGSTPKTDLPCANGAR